MKRIIPILSLLLVFGFAELAKAQLAKDSWAVGFGFNYPRFVNVNVTPLNNNYGGYLSLQRNFSEHVGARLGFAYSHFTGEYTNAASILTESPTNAITGDLDFIYNFVPCEPVSPYAFFGVGGIYRMLDANRATAVLDDNALALQVGAGVGLNWVLDEDWQLTTEFAYRLTSNSELDGALGLNEFNAKDSYMTVKLGLMYFLDKGEPSKYCQLYSGISPDQRDLTDYDKIEDMIKRHIPKEVVKEVVVEKPAKAAVADKWVLIGVNFEFNSAKFNAESYPILLDAAKTLQMNPSVNVEIQGHTDNIGSESYNQKLSEKRANAVKNYLIGKGVSASRLTTVGAGEGSPIADNNSAEGRAANRRIEFKVR
jgi:OOP family OmpA-OmpF porin